MPDNFEFANAQTLAEFSGLGNYNNYSLDARFNNLITGQLDRRRDDYQTYLDNYNRQYEMAKINNSRAWEEYMDSTKYQRMAEDLRRAGINPALAFASGIGAAGQPSSPSGSSSAKASYERPNKSTFAQSASSAAMVVMAIAKIAWLALAA